MGSVAAEYPQPDHFLLHFSDTHFVNDGLLYGGVDAGNRLLQAFTAVRASSLRPEAVIFTGDLTDKGEPEAYRELRRAAEEFTDAIGADLIWVVGNHDERNNVRTLLLDEAPDDAPVDRKYTLGGLRLLVLDSSVPGAHHGELSESQLDWIARELEDPAPDGTILVLHHPPIPCIQDLAVLTELRNQEALARVVRDRDVLAILAGHLHFPASSTFAGIPVSVAPSTSYTQDLAYPGGGMQGRDGAQGFNLVYLYGRTVVNSVVHLGQHPPVGSFVSAEEISKRLATAGVHIPPAPPSRERAELADSRNS